MAILQSLNVSDVGSLTVPSGTSNNRPTVNKTVVSFTSTPVGGTWTVPAGVTQLEVLVVAGGGGGGSGFNNDACGGGGGAGGLIYNSNYPVVPGSALTVVVGAGGAGGSNGVSDTGGYGGNGSNSQFGSLIALGGGGGTNYPDVSGRAGGSGGGSGGAGRTVAAGGYNAGGLGTLGQGNPGGYNAGNGQSADSTSCGGGGGAGTAGKNGVAGKRGGDGGMGLAYDISGTLTYYAGGGGGGASQTPFGGSGGIGGGGAGGQSQGANGVAGTANTGGGGGGGSTNTTNTAGGAGGSGIVIVRYALTAASAIPVAQTRYNSDTRNIEVFHPRNTFDPSPTGEDIVTNGLIGHWDAKFYTTGTTWTDLSGNGNNITLNGTITHNSTVGYFSQDGSTSNYAILNPFQYPTTYVTQEGWFWADQVGNNNGYLISYATSASDNSALLGSTSNLAYFSPSASASSGYNMMGKGWQHVARTSNRLTGEEILYLNGKRIHSSIQSIGTLNAQGGALVIGQEQDSVGGTFDAGQSLIGRYAIVRIYGRTLSDAEIEKNYNAQRGRFGLVAPMISLGAGSPGSTPSTAAANAKQIKELTGTTTNGFYWLRPGNLDPVYVWCDMNYDGGGWTLVMANCRAGSFAGANTSNGIGALSYFQCLHNNNIAGHYSNKLQFKQFVGLKYWPGLGLNVCQIASTGTPTLSDTLNHTKRYRWSYTGFGPTYGFQGYAAVGDDGSGAGAPGMGSYHAANGWGLTTYDADNDVATNNCAGNYGNNPWWYGACWSGNMWGGGNSGSYGDQPHWDSSGTDNHAYMAVYLKV